MEAGADDIDYESPTWQMETEGWSDGDSVVGRVAGALYDIFDSSNDTMDKFSDGFSRIWNVMLTGQDYGIDVFFTFWMRWLDEPYPRQPTIQAIFQNTIDYGVADLNADYIADIFDLATVALAFGSVPGDPNWNPTADISLDNLVEISDIAIVASHFGNTYI